jgi:hypothetical protein
MLAVAEAFERAGLNAPVESLPAEEGRASGPFPGRPPSASALA